MDRIKWLHLGVSAAAGLIFLFIPLIFLTNINLMLFPDKWASVHGFLSALILPNVFPRYIHFLLACPAMTGLFLVWLFRRRSDAEIAATGFARADLIRIGYQWALWPTVAQFFVGPITLFTLPQTQAPSARSSPFSASAFWRHLPVYLAVQSRPVGRRKPSAGVSAPFVS